jgi:hypothetical protein
MKKPRSSVIQPKELFKTARFDLKSFILDATLGAINMLDMRGSGPKIPFRSQAPWTPYLKNLKHKKI